MDVSNSEIGNLINNKSMRRKYILTPVALLFSLTIAAQQSNINLSHNPQKDTEGLIPFSANLNSPQVNDDQTVIFRLKAPKAESVALSSGAITTVLGLKGTVPFTKGDDGIWTLKLGPLPVDMYQYNLVVDGVSMADPNNTYASFTAMPPYSELIIHGDKPTWYDAQNVPHGAVTRHVYHSDVTGGEREMYVYTPPFFDSNKKYPVLYLMGGSGELPSNWIYDGRVNFIMDNLLAEGKVKPMIIAIVNNQVVHRNHPRHAELSFDIMDREYREVIIPFIDKNYKTIANPKGRAISGLSMGGRHTIFVGLNSTDLFSNFGILSAGDNNCEKTIGKFLNDPKANDKVDVLFIGQGGGEESGFFNARVKGLRDALDSRKIDYKYLSVGKTGHDWSTWRNLLYQGFLPMLWK